MKAMHYSFVSYKYTVKCFDIHIHVNHIPLDTGYCPMRFLHIALTVRWPFYIIYIMELHCTWSTSKPVLDMTLVNCISKSNFLDQS